MSFYLMALTIAVQATPSTPADASDARCALAIMAIEPNVTGEHKAAMQAGTMFFIGKLLGRGGQKGAIDAISEQEQSFDPTQAAALAIRCGEEMRSIGAVLVAAGE